MSTPRATVGPSPRHGVPHPDCHSGTPPVQRQWSVVNRGETKAQGKMRMKRWQSSLGWGDLITSHRLPRTPITHCPYWPPGGGRVQGTKRRHLREDSPASHHCCPSRGDHAPQKPPDRHNRETRAPSSKQNCGRLIMSIRKRPRTPWQTPFGGTSRASTPTGISL